MNKLYIYIYIVYSFLYYKIKSKSKNNIYAFTFQMNLYEQCVLHVVKHQEQLDTSVLPETIRNDINVVTTLLNDIKTWEAKIAEKEEVQKEVNLWLYIEECLIVYYENSDFNFSYEERKYWEEIQDIVEENDRKMQDIDLELEIFKNIVKDDKANFPPHLSHIFEQITLNDYSRLFNP